jgi:hypothetical protein
MYKKLSLVCIGLAVAVMAVWVLKGAHMTAKNEIFVAAKPVLDKDGKPVVDDFGDPKIEPAKHIPNPDKYPFGLVDGAAPIAGALFGLGLVIFVVGRRKES